MPDPQDSKTKPQTRPAEREGYAKFEGVEIEIFRAGTYPQGTYTEDDLQVIADTYDPTVHEAPITLDHAEQGPAHGWIGTVRRVGSKLVAIPSMVGAEFKELFKGGQYRKVSAELYTDFMGMGKPYLKAVSFLGARAPQVKGLAPATFNEAFGQAIKVPFEKEEEMTPEEIKKIADDAAKAAVAKFAEENEELRGKLKETEAKFAEADKKAKDVATKLSERDKADAARAAEAHKQRVASFCEKLKGEGKLLPAWEDAGLREFMQSLSSGEDRVVAFGEGEKAKKITQLEFMESFLGGLPKVVDFEEKGKGAKRHPASAKFNEANAEYEVENLELRDLAVTIFEEENGKGNRITFSEALTRARRQLAK